MKVAALVAGIAVLLCACDRKPHTSETPTPGSGEQSASAAPAPALTTKVSATREQLGSSVGVRVVAGALVANVTGAILHRDELPAGELFFDQHRCVAALLKGWTEAQLKSKSATIHIFRNLPNKQGQPQPHAYRAKLLQFDEKTGIALFTYPQGFSASADLGFRIVRGEESTPAQAVALRTGAIDPGEEAILLSQRRRAEWEVFQPIPVDEGRMDITAPGSGKLKFPPRDAALPNDGVLITTGTASLLGFATHNGTGSAELVRIPALQIAVQTPTLVPVKASFVRNVNRDLKLVLSMEQRGFDEPLRKVWIRQAVVPAGTQVDLKTFSEPSTAIPVDRADGSQPAYLRDDQTVQVDLQPPQRTNEEITYLVQVAWAASSEEPEPAFYSRPFLVNVATRDGGISATTEGIAGPAAPSAEDAAARIATFKLEAPVLSVFPIAEGREVLLQLKGDPHWKRFSMEKKTWLPLPPLNLGAVDLAGNRSSLIVLNRSAGEVRRYQLSDLKLVTTAKLTMPGEEILNVRAGCLSDEAPIHILCSKGPISLNATTLQRSEDSASRPNPNLTASTAASFRATGDGITLLSLQSFESSMTYRGDLVGLRQHYFDTGFRHTRGAISVSGAFDLERQIVSTCAEPSGAWKTLIEVKSSDGQTPMFGFPNAPVVGRLRSGDPQSIPPVPARVELFSLWHAAPFASVQAPGLESLAGAHLEQPRLKDAVCIDLHSRRFGLLDRDLTTWTVCDLDPPDDLGRGILLNWPETTVKRSGEFRFVPQLLGKASISAELLGTREPTPVTVDEKGISFRVAENELASLLLLNLTITGEKAADVVSIPIHVGGVAPPFISPDLTSGADADEFGNGFKSLLLPRDRRIPLKTHFYQSPYSIKEILPLTADLVALHTEANRLELFSLSTRKIAGSIPTATYARYFAGCDAIYEYDTTNRRLTRINVPDGKRGVHITFPADVDLDAIALGTQRDHPISLFLNKRFNQRSAQLGDMRYTTWRTTRGLVVVNSQTLQSGYLAQPTVWTAAGNEQAASMAINPIVSGKGPIKLASSRNGSIVTLANHFAVILPRFAIVAPFPGPATHSGLYSSAEQAEGSLTGIVATSTRAISRNGILEDSRTSDVGTPCGRYTLVKLETNQSGGNSYEVRSLENGQPMFRLNRIAALSADPADIRAHTRSSIQILGENSPAVIQSTGNKLLQFVDFDIPQLAAQVTPEHLHVTSQPNPFVMEGAAYEYQVKTNNPTLVKSFRLRQAMPNTTISPTGLVRMVAPRDIPLTDRVPIGIEIETTTGSSVLHDFSVVVLGKKLNAAPQAPARVTPPVPTPGQPRTL